MSLLFNYVVDQFSPVNATLYTATKASLSSSDDTVPVRLIANFASLHDELAHPDPDREWTCIPLHEVDTAVPTGEFIGYIDHAVRGEIFLVEHDGAIDDIPAERFQNTRLANQIRFWHSDYLPETFPPGYSAPIDDHEPPQNPISDTDTDLLDEFQMYISDERAAVKQNNIMQAQRQSARTQYDRGGSAIPDIRLIKKDSSEYHFRVNADTHQEARRDDDWAYFIESEFGIYQENLVSIHADGEDAPKSFPIPAEVERIRGRDIWLTIKWTSIENPAAVNTYLNGIDTVGCSILLNPIPFTRELNAIEKLRGSTFHEVLVGECPLTFSNEAAALSDSFDNALNQEQELAVKYALLADQLFCIHGPPGTGKTRTLLEVIRRAVDAGETVLVCADSNQAVDNIVVGNSTKENTDGDSLHAYGQYGDEEFILNRINPERSTHTVVQTSYHDVTRNADVIATTNSSAATLSQDFDLLVLDEATQSTCTASCIPLVHADRAVLAGDHRQLPPFSATEDPPESSYGLSLFEHLYADGGVYENIGIQLRTQYRMHPDIASFSNREFYNQALRTGKIIKPVNEKPVIEAYNVGGAVEVVDHSRINKTEARLVIHLIQDVLDDIPAGDIGVITPYAAQARFLQGQLHDHTDRAGLVTIDTIDSFQGSEKTAIIISLVRSNAEGDIGFLGRPEDGPRRLNVALTRARRYCAVVGDFHTLRYDNESKCTTLYNNFWNFFNSTGRLRDVDPAFIEI